MQDSQNSRDLVLRAQNGEREAFDQLAELYRVRLDQLVRSRMGEHLKRTYDVEDVLQDALLGAFRGIDRFEWQGEDSFFRWLSRICENTIRKLAARYQREQKLSLDRDIPGDSTPPSASLRRNERFDRLERALADLRPDYREVICLARIEGLRTKEIAVRMNRSPEAVMQLLCRALKALRKAFGDTESFRLPPRSLDQKRYPDHDES